jgi:hypothetical protein
MWIPTVPGVRLASKPTASALRLFETEMGVKLPVDYHSFIQLFGPGELAGEFFLLGPGYPTSNIDLKLHTLEFRRGVQRSPWIRQSFDDLELLSRLLFFCRTFHGDKFGWDPTDITNPEGDDYRIHLLRHESRKTEIVANSFREFIEDLCLGEVYFTRYSLTGERTVTGPREIFNPAVDPPSRRSKKAGPSSD